MFLLSFQNLISALQFVYDMPPPRLHAASTPRAMANGKFSRVSARVKGEGRQSSRESSGTASECLRLACTSLTAYLMYCTLADDV